MAEPAELAEEIEIVNAIYEDIAEAVAPGIVIVHLSDSVSIRLGFPLDYPVKPPRIVQTNPANLQAPMEELVANSFMPGEVFIYTFIDEGRQLIESMPENTPIEVAIPAPQVKGSQFISEWAVTEPIVDRKSTFVGWAHRIESVAQAMTLIEDLERDNKVSRASHNMWALRLRDASTGLLIQDCNDDGESAAGSRMLHLLDIVDACPVVVVVSRWYGGTHIGADRFKHINSATRAALVAGGFLN